MNRAEWKPEQLVFDIFVTQIKLSLVLLETLLSTSSSGCTMHTCGSVTIELVFSFWHVLVDFRGN